MPLPSIGPWVERLARASLIRDGHRVRHVHTRVGRLHVYDARGRGPLPTIAMLHGIGSNATAFGPLLAHLRRRARRVVALDYPGHGFSDAPSELLTPKLLFEATTAALDDVLEEPAVLCGNSLGGAVALHYAVARPARVRALVLVSPAGARISDEEMREVISAFNLGSRAEAARFLERIYHRVPWYAPLLSHEVLAVLGKPAVRQLLDSASVDQAPSAEALRALPMPVLLLWGRSERLFPRTALDYFRANLPQHAIIEEPDACGHSPHLDRPREVAARIDRFVRELPRP